VASQWVGRVTGTTPIFLFGPSENRSQILVILGVNMIHLKHRRCHPTPTQSKIYHWFQVYQLALLWVIPHRPKLCLIFNITPALRTNHKTAKSPMKICNHAVQKKIFLHFFYLSPENMCHCSQDLNRHLQTNYALSITWISSNFVTKRNIIYIVQ
jgi:hypothetical protein